MVIYFTISILDRNFGYGVHVVRATLEAFNYNFKIYFNYNNVIISTV